VLIAVPRSASERIGRKLRSSITMPRRASLASRKESLQKDEDGPKNTTRGSSLRVLGKWAPAPLRKRTDETNKRLSLDEAANIYQSRLSIEEGPKVDRSRLSLDEAANIYQSRLSIEEGPKVTRSRLSLDEAANIYQSRLSIEEVSTSMHNIYQSTIDKHEDSNVDDLSMV
jgi:hypothetical protein